MYNIPAIIFAGGKSTRMGEDKALLPFKGYKTMSEFQYKKLEKYFDTVYLSSKEKKFDFESNIILDTHNTYSPLVALLSIFNTLNVETIFVLSVDTPLVDKNIISTLFHDYDKKFDAIIAESPHGIQPLCGFYNRSIVGHIEKALVADMHKLTRLLKQANTHFVLFKEEHVFTNLNYKHEYEKLQ